MSEEAVATPPKKKRKKKRKADTPTVEEARRTLAAEARRTWIRRGFVTLAALYLVTLWLDGIGTPLWRWLPGGWVFFAEVAALFPWASPRVIDYRAEGWSCADRKWEEIDVRPFFPIDRDNKESRFQRAMQFYKRNRAVMHALDDYVVGRWNDGHDKIGGVRFLSLRIPYPKPGQHVRPYAWEPLSHFPKDQRHDWYWTRKSKRAERCGYVLPPKPATDDEPDEPPPLSKEQDREKELEP